MGMLKDVDASLARKDAIRALEAGRRTFAAKLGAPNSFRVNAIDVWSVEIDAIESVGWRLEHWTVGVDSKGHPEAYPLFRRV